MLFFYLSYKCTKNKIKQNKKPQINKKTTTTKNQPNKTKPNKTQPKKLTKPLEIFLTYKVTHVKLQSQCRCAM